jgi:hypothetical protein
MRILVDLNDPRLSPTARLTLSNLANTLRPAPRPASQGHIESVDEALGKPERKQ